MKRTVWLLALTVLLAGCTDATSDDGDDVRLQDVDVKEDSGAISGVVIDATVRPIEGATVKLDSLDLESTTNKDGQFSFQDVAAGLYSIKTTAQGYLDATYSVDVVNGEVAKMKVQLAEDYSPDPYQDTLPFRGYADASVGLASWTVDFVIDAVGMTDDAGACQCFFRYGIEDNLTATVLEVTWEENVQNQLYESEYYYEVYADGNAFLVKRGYGTDPIHVVIDADDYQDVKDFKLWVYPDDVWPAAQQDFEIFITNFYHGEPPDGWSFVAGDD